MNAKYRVQLPPNGNWSEWRDIEVPIKEPHILSVQISETVTQDEFKKFMQQIKLEP